MTKKKSSGTRRRRSPSVPREAAALKLALKAVRKKLSSDEAFYEKVVWRFQERHHITQEKAWDEIDDFLEKADMIASQGRRPEKHMFLKPEVTKDLLLGSATAFTWNTSRGSLSPSMKACST